VLTMTATGAPQVVGARRGHARGCWAVGMDLTVLSVALPLLPWPSRPLSPTSSVLSGYAWSVAGGKCCRRDSWATATAARRSCCSLLALSLPARLPVPLRTPAEFIGARVLLGFAGAGLLVMAVSASQCSSPKRKEK